MKELFFSLSYEIYELFFFFMNLIFFPNSVGGFNSREMGFVFLL